MKEIYLFQTRPYNATWSHPWAITSQGVVKQWDVSFAIARIPHEMVKITMGQFESGSAFMTAAESLLGRSLVLRETCLVGELESLYAVP